MADNTVTFLVGPERFLADKEVLCSKSPLFEEMFSESANREVLIKDEAKVFVELLAFVNGQDVKIDRDNVLKILCASEKYKVQGLKFMCGAAMEKMLVQNKSATNVFQFLEASLLYNCTTTVDKTKDIILANPLAYLSTPQFLDISESTFRLIISSPEIISTCNSISLSRASQKWLSHNGHEREQPAVDLT
jgi:hypothetical protein